MNLWGVEGSPYSSVHSAHSTQPDTNHVWTAQTCVLPRVKAYMPVCMNAVAERASISEFDGDVNAWIYEVTKDVCVTLIS